MTESKRPRAGMHWALPSSTIRSLLLVALSALLLIAGPAGTAIAYLYSPLQPRGYCGALLALEQAKLTAADGAADDHFGYMVAISGDTALVGAPFKSVDGQSQAGAAYVFVRSGASWSERAELTAPDGAAGDCFGRSLALSGDTALIGAWGKSVAGQSQAGAAYVFTRSAASWSEQAELTASDGAADDELGFSVALSGDTALLGAWGKSVAGQSQAGAAYVFTRSGRRWSQQAELTAGDVVAGDFFGRSVALSGDTALVGALHKTVAGVSKAGAAYVFTGSGKSWSEQAKLTAGYGAGSLELGCTVAVSGDTALLGAYHKCPQGLTFAGGAYVFTRAGAAWSQQAELTVSDAAAYDKLGRFVALSGDTALLGAYSHTVDGKNNAGAAYVFTRSATTWSQQLELTASDGAEGDIFGWSVALSGHTALIGASWQQLNGQRKAGAVYVDVLKAAPSLSLKAQPSSIKVGRTVTLSGTVKHFLSTDTKVLICRQAGKHLTVLKTLKLTRSGAFKWATKPGDRGKWVFVATYESGGVTYLSEPVSVTVHK